MSSVTQSIGAFYANTVTFDVGDGMVYFSRKS
jgi:hypothetical protein